MLVRILHAQNECKGTIIARSLFMKIEAGHVHDLRGLSILIRSSRRMKRVHLDADQASR